MQEISLISIFEHVLASYYYWGLVVIIFFDWITGTFKSKLWNVTDSSVGWKGVAKHVTVILGMGLVWTACIAFNSEAVAIVITTMYALNYGISILENMAVMGIYTPKFLLVKVKAEQRRYEEKFAEAIGVPVEDVRSGNVPDEVMQEATARIKPPKIDKPQG